MRTKARKREANGVLEAEPLSCESAAIIEVRSRIAN
jgi:hypothetical protein